MLLQNNATPVYVCVSVRFFWEGGGGGHLL